MPISFNSEESWKIRKLFSMMSMYHIMSYLTEVIIKYNDIPQHACSASLIPVTCFLIKLKQAPNIPIISINNDFSMRIIYIYILFLSHKYKKTRILYNFKKNKNVLTRTIEVEGGVGLRNFACTQLFSLIASHK